MKEQNVLFATEDQLIDTSDTVAEVLTDKFLIFISDGLRFGVNAEYVVEIITNHTITHLPMVPDFIKGIINLRGQIIPIVDMCLRLGKPTNNDTCIVVLNIEGTLLGILVNMVDQMVDIPQGDILPMPAQNSEKMVAGMCSLPDGSGTMLLLDCPLLLHE